MSTIAERKLAWGFGLALTVLAANALISYHDLADLSANTGQVVRSREILEERRGFRLGLEGRRVGPSGLSRRRRLRPTSPISRRPPPEHCPRRSRRFRA